MLLNVKNLMPCVQNRGKDAFITLNNNQSFILAHELHEFVSTMETSPRYGSVYPGLANMRLWAESTASRTI